ncbi:MAG TPA: histidine phosphatase family protein [Acidimicrobiales bacterium]|nr:histidine phosphatase family protein [Acidimicrobiales bacterium]
MTASIVLVRNGRAAAGFDADRDPGLDDVGRAEAASVAAALGPLGPLPLVTSPLLRCRETVAPLASRWGIEATVDPAVAEVAAPTDDLAGRAAWLREAMSSRWSDLGSGPRAWRDQVLAAVRALAVDTVVVTHFVVINVVIGAARGDDAVLVERVANGSRTTIDVGPDGGLHLVAVGTVGESRVG